MGLAGAHWKELAASARLLIARASDPQFGQLFAIIIDAYSSYFRFDFPNGEG
jgi:hypothetical protein